MNQGQDRRVKVREQRLVCAEGVRMSLFVFKENIETRYQEFYCWKRLRKLKL